jgi:hypothetical protein
MTKRKVIVVKEPDCEVRPVPGFEGLYSVSADGRIWSHAKTMGLSRHGGRWLIAGTNKGYLVVALFKDQKQTMMSVHRAVAMAWVPNPRNKPDVNHLDGNKGNANAQNLEWCDRSENLVHAYRTGLRRDPRLTKVGARARAGLLRNPNLSTTATIESTL